MRKIYYSPFENSENDYCNRMKYFLSKYGAVIPFDKKKIIYHLFLMKSKDFVIFNWLENIIIKNNKFSILGFFKVLCVFISFRLSMGTLVFVKHNNYPHNCRKKDIEKAKWAIRMLEKIANKVIVHSKPDTDSKNLYVPHPLYKDIVNHSTVNKDNDTYIVFGRILPYKKIENLIKVFPENKKLVIAGACTDQNYLEKIKKASQFKKNIKIIPRFLDDDEIKFLVEESTGILITHNDDDMIVSGSFFYAMTLRSKVFALETPFFKWAEKQMGNKYITNFKSLDDLDMVLSGEIEQITGKGFSMIDLFGEESIHKSLSYLFNGNIK